MEPPDGCSGKISCDLRAVQGTEECSGEIDLKLNEEEVSPGLSSVQNPY